MTRLYVQVTTNKNPEDAVRYNEMAAIFFKVELPGTRYFLICKMALIVLDNWGRGM
jgi:hypothetical protein